MSTKAELRSRIAAALGGLSPADAAARSERIRGRVLALPEITAARSIFTYVSFAGEADTRGLIADFLAARKTVLVPRIVGDGILEAHRIDRLDDLAPGKFGILAPRDPRPFEGCPDVTLCPGVAFDPRGGRLGRGKGYYDRFLAGRTGTFAAGLTFERQVVDAVPVGPHDRPVDAVITEDRTIRCR